MRQLALFEPQSAVGAPDEAAARAKALQAAQSQADSLCRGFAATTAYRFGDATPQPATWNCEHGGGGMVCGFEGMVACQLDERATVEHETCATPRPRPPA